MGLADNPFQNALWPVGFQRHSHGRSGGQKLQQHAGQMAGCKPRQTGNAQMPRSAGGQIAAKFFNMLQTIQNPGHFA